MRKAVVAAFAAVLTLSLAANLAFGWLLWRAQGEYRALARQFVKVKQEAAALQAAARAPERGGPSGPAGAGAATPAPGATPASAAGAAEPARAATASQTVTAPAAARPAGASGPAAPRLSSAQVRQRFEPRFEAVQSDCEGQLNAMLADAKADYQQAKAAGQEIDVGAMGAKYFTRAERLQRTCDRQVEGLLSEMAAELRANGLSMDLVAEVRDYYETRVVERRAEIMAKVGQQ